MESMKQTFITKQGKSSGPVIQNEELVNLVYVNAREPQQLESIHADNEDARGSQHDC
jgi:K+/H+ antiporter YhaU regulatory subunit KhtT